MRQFSFLTLAAFLTGLSLLASPAQAASLNDWLNKFFGKDNTPKPEETLIAPFADPGVAKVNGPNPQQLTMSLRAPHRASRDIGVWAVTAVSNAISFTAAAPADQLKDKKSFFDEKGFGEYSDFISSVGLLNSPDGQSYDITGFVPQEPVLLNEGELNGAYRWLFEMPVMVTYQHPGLMDYKGVRPIVKSYKVRLQIGRVAEGDTGEGILIQSWQGQPIKTSGSK